MPRVEIAVRVLDEYLLTGEVPREDVLAVADRLRTYYADAIHSGKRWKLPDEFAREVPQDECEAFEALLRFRLWLVGGSHLNESLLLKLRLVCKSCRLMREYVRGSLSKRLLENKLDDAQAEYSEQFTTNADENEYQFIAERCDEMHLMLNHVKYCIAMVGSQEYETERIDVVDACVRAVRRLETYWYNVLENRTLMFGD